MAGSSGVNVKMGITGISQFKNGMNQAKQAAKTLDAQLSLTEKEFRATGDAEGYMAKKAEELKAKLEAQRAVVDNAEKALEQMAKNGVDRSSTSYQKLYQEMLKAKGEMLDTENALNGVAEAGDEAADEVSEMNAQLKRIGDGVSYDNITNGLEKIKTGIENVIAKAFKMGEALVRNTLGAGSWADELATTATQWEDTLEAMSGGKSATEFLQRMRYTSSIIDTDVDTILDASDKLRKNREKGGKEFMGALAYLGIDPHGKNDLDLFWEAGEAIQALGKDEDKVSYANNIFGKSWRDLMPLFKAGREEYDRTMESWSVVSDEQIEKLTKMDDAYQTMNNEWTTLKTTVLSELSTVLTPLMEKLTALMQQFNEYLQTEEGQAMLQHLSDVLLGMFEDIAKIDPDEVMKGLIKIFDDIKKGLKWIIENKQTLVDALKVIAAGFGVLQLGTLAVNVKKIYDGFKGLLGLGGGGGVEKAITGGLKTTITNGITGLTSQAGAWLTSTGVGNMLPGFGDWLVHNTGLGQEYILGTKEKGSTFREIGDNAKQWWDTVQGLAGNNLKYWQGIMAQQGQASEWILGDDATAEDAMAFVRHQTWMQKMDSIVDTLLGDRTNDNKATSEMAAAANNMQGLPAAIEMAVRNGVSNIRVYIDGQLVSNSVGSTMANAIAGLVR